MSVVKFFRTPPLLLPKQLVYNASIRCITKNFVEENSKEIKTDPKEKITLETSLRYLSSKAYQTTYGGLPVWTYYRRNFKGQFPPETRRNCITNGKINNASPCPICRDEYLVVDYQNIELIKQFISPFGGHVLESKKTGVCQAQHKKILVAIQKAKDLGLISFDMPHRSYNYNLYKKNF